MTQWIPVNPGLVMEAAKLLSQGADDDGSRGDVTHVPPALVAALAEYLGEGADCDHSVGICACEWAGVAYELRLALEGNQTCRKCGGDGFEWDAQVALKTFNDAAVRYKISVNEAEALLGDSAGMIGCPNCLGKGVEKVSETS